MVQFYPLSFVFCVINLNYSRRSVSRICLVEKPGNTLCFDSDSVSVSTVKTSRLAPVPRGLKRTLKVTETAD